MKKLLVYVAVTLQTLSYAMEQSTPKLITLDGHTATLTEHIERSKKLMNLSTLSTTLLLRYENGQIHDLGDLSLVPSSALEDIHRDNYVFFAGYAVAKTRLSNDHKQLVNAVILGTTDQSILGLETPLGTVLREKRKNYKKNQTARTKKK